MACGRKNKKYNDYKVKDQKIIKGGKKKSGSCTYTISCCKSGSSSSGCGKSSCFSSSSGCCPYSSSSCSSSRCSSSSSTCTISCCSSSSSSSRCGKSSCFSSTSYCQCSSPSCISSRCSSSSSGCCTYTCSGSSSSSSSQCGPVKKRRCSSSRQCGPIKKKRCSSSRQCGPVKRGKKGCSNKQCGPVKRGKGCRAEGSKKKVLGKRFVVSVEQHKDGYVYAMDGVYAKTLNLRQGHTYEFDVKGKHGCAFYFSTNAVGGDINTCLPGTHAVASGKTRLYVTKDTPKYFYYGDKNNKFMGGLIKIYQ